jgi:hypothetical protein
MAIQFYIGDEVDFEINEKKQYERVKQLMIDYFQKKKDMIYIVVDHIINGVQFDLIVIKKKAIIAIEMKNYKGNIRIQENGPWVVEKQNGDYIEIDRNKNPYKQSRAQRYAIINYINETYPQISNIDQTFRNISAAVCFVGDSKFDLDYFNSQQNIWFNVTSENDLPKLIDEITSKEFTLKSHTIKKLLEMMNVKMIENYDNTIENTKTFLISNEDLYNTSVKINNKYGDDSFSYSDLANILDAEFAARFIGEGRDKEIIDEYENNMYKLNETWKTLKNEIKMEEEISVKRSALDKFNKNDFYLKDENAIEGKEYNGIYRGSIYHLGYNKRVWWKLSDSSIRIKAKFTDKTILDKILELKPQGGSFRITESKEVLTKVLDEKEGYIPYFVCKFIGNVELEYFQWDPTGLKIGDLWPSKYDGSVLSVNSNRKLLVRIGEVKSYAIEGYEDIVTKVLKYKTNGGRFVINENGKIITLMYSAPYPKTIRNQIEKLSDKEKNLINYRHEKEKDGMVPIYLGTISLKNIKFGKVFDIHKEWTEEDDESFLKRIGVK